MSVAALKLRVPCAARLPGLGQSTWSPECRQHGSRSKAPGFEQKKVRLIASELPLIRFPNQKAPIATMRAGNPAAIPGSFS